jgi:hypothetical protein
VEIEGLTELERSGLKEQDPEMYEKVRRLLTIHTLDEWIRFKRTNTTREQKVRFVRIICRLERNSGNKGIFDRHTRFEQEIDHLNRCWTLPTDNSGD